MNKLIKRTWINLCGATACIIIGALGVGLAVKFNVKGIIPLISFIIAGPIAALITSLRSISTVAGFDEREKKISVRAFTISSYFFMFFMVYACFIIFYLSGARNSIPSYTLPVLLLIGLFISQIIHSAVILIRFAREQADEQ